MAQAIHDVWLAEVRVVDLFIDLVVLDSEYALAGKPTTKAAKTWREDHPEYDQLEQRIARLQEERLDKLRWGKTQSLADYYRRCIALLSHENHILVPEPVLVEGLPITEANSPTSTDTDEEGKPQSNVIRGVIGNVEVAGVPDVLARGEAGEWIIADYKTGRPQAAHDIAESAQLAMYVELLRQNGFVGRQDGPHLSDQRRCAASVG